MIHCNTCGHTIETQGAVVTVCPACFVAIEPPPGVRATAGLQGSTTTHVTIRCQRMRNIQIEIPWGEDKIVGREAHGWEALEPLRFVSRRHFRVTFEGAAAYAQDVGSREGTEVGFGRQECRTTKRLLVDGEPIVIGGEVFNVAFTRADAPATTGSRRDSTSARTPVPCGVCGSPFGSGAACASCGSSRSELHGP